MCLKRVLGVAALCVASSATAQEWDWKIAPYLWGAGIQGDMTVREHTAAVDVEFSEILNVLAGAAIVHVEGGTEHHVLLADLVWMRLEPEDVETAGGSAEAEFDSTILELGYRRASDGPSLELGIRYWDMEIGIDPPQLESRTRGASWTDGWIGIRFDPKLGDHWTLTVRANAGAGGSDSTLGASAQFRRRLESGNELIAGFKALSVDYSEGGNGNNRVGLDSSFMGTTVGFAFD